MAFLHMTMLQTKKFQKAEIKIYVGQMLHNSLFFKIILNCLPTGFSDKS